MVHIDGDKNNFRLDNLKLEDDDGSGWGCDEWRVIS